MKYTDLHITHFRILADCLRLKKSFSTADIENLLKNLNLDNIIIKLVQLRNFSPSGWDIVMALLYGGPISSNQVFLGLSGNAFCGRISLESIAARDGALRRISCNTIKDLQILIDNVGINDNITVFEALTLISNEAKKNNSLFKQYSKEIVEICNNLQSSL